MPEADCSSTLDSSDGAGDGGASFGLRSRRCSGLLNPSGDARRIEVRRRRAAGQHNRGHKTLGLMEPSFPMAYSVPVSRRSMTSLRS